MEWINILLLLVAFVFLWKMVDIYYKAKEIERFCEEQIARCVSLGLMEPPEKEDG